MYVLNVTYIAVVGGFVAALYVLGALTFREIYKLMRLGVQTE